MIFYAVDKNTIYLYTQKHLQHIELEDFLEALSLPEDHVVFTLDASALKKFVNNQIQDDTTSYITFINVQSYIRDKDKDSVEKLITFLTRDRVIDKAYSYVETAMANDFVNYLVENEKNLLFDMQDDEIKHIESAYIGGRNEVYIKEATGDIVNYDINSAYPFVLLQPLPDYSSQQVNVRYINNNDKYFYIIKARVHVPDYVKFSPIGVRISENNLSFINGHIEGYFTSLDLNDDVRIERIDEVYRYNLTHYDHLSYIVNSLYNERKNTDDVIYKDYLKKQLVLLYGRLAIKQQNLLRNRLIGVYITAFVRNKLLNMIKIADKYSDVLYCDTDCVIVKHHTQQDRLVLEKALNVSQNKDAGKINIRDEYEHIKIFNKKRYMVKPKDSDDYILRYSGVNQTSAHIDFQKGEIEIYDVWNGGSQKIPLETENDNVIINSGLPNP